MAAAVFLCRAASILVVLLSLSLSDDGDGEGMAVSCDARLW